MLTRLDIEKYFVAEKQAGLVLFVIGIAALVLAALCFFVLRTNFYKGAAIPLMLIGTLQLFLGFSHYRKSDEERKQNVYAYDMNPQELKARELPRMQGAVKSIAVFKWGAAVLVLIGAVLVMLYRSHPDKTLWVGLGAALAMQALIMYVAEYMAEGKAQQYLQQLETFGA